MLERRWASPKMKRWVLIAVAFHFAVILVGVTDPKVDGTRPFWQVVSWYGKTTGASAQYCFFSPNIPREVMFRFVIRHRDQTVTETTLQETANSEVNARIGNILRMIPKNYKDRTVVRSLAASLTASMFRLFPDADSIQIKSELYLLPTMEQYQAGKRADHMKVYSATFQKSSRKNTSSTWPDLPSGKAGVSL